MHGGLFSQDNVTLDDIKKVERRRQPPEEGEDSHVQTPAFIGHFFLLH